jgi:hypothetical protein
MVREAKPLTRVVPLESSARSRHGRVVLEVQDPESAVPIGEQLSLVTPDAAPAKSSRKRTTPKSTVSKAKQTSPIDEVSLTVPHRAAADAADPMLERVQQLSATIEQLQSQLAQLHRPAADAIAPTIKAAKSRVNAAPHPHLPDWSEPELRSHYTLKESARTYEALEALHSHRKLQRVDAGAIDQAYAVADQLRHAPAPSRQRRSQRPKPRSRWQWQPQTLWRNLQQFGQSIVPVPVTPDAKVLDVGVWVVGAIGLRLAIKALIYLMPLLALPLNVLMAIPAIVAAYLAFCVPNSRSDVIYRLLLVTLGLFLGSRI